MDGDSSWRTRSEVLQYMENTGVFRHVVGHGTALAHVAVFPVENSTVAISDHHPERSGSSGIDRFASSVEPGKVFISWWIYSKVGSIPTLILKSQES
jgi:hypothetical protein